MRATVLKCREAQYVPELTQPVLEALGAKGVMHCMELMWGTEPRRAVQEVPELRHTLTPMPKLNVAATNHSCLRIEKSKH